MNQMHGAVPELVMDMGDRAGPGVLERIVTVHAAA